MSDLFDGRDNRFIMSFVDKSVSIVPVGNNKTVATIRSGFSASKFEKHFEDAGFATLPEFVASILLKYGYRKNHKTGMWTIKTTGVSKCSPEDTYDETVGGRVALMRAKAKAYDTAARVISEIDDVLFRMSDICSKSLGQLYVYLSDEYDAIDRVIETGKSDK